MSNYPVPARRSSGFGAFLFGALTLAILGIAAYIAWFGLPTLPAGPLTINGQPAEPAPALRNLAPAAEQIPAAPAALPAAAPERVQGIVEQAPAGVTSGAGQYVEAAPVEAPAVAPAPASEPAGITGAIDAAPQPAPAGKGMADRLNFDGGVTGAVDSGGGITGGAGAMTK